MRILTNPILPLFAIPYFSKFRKISAKHLNVGISMMVFFYPYPRGIVAVVDLNKEDRTQNVFKVPSLSKYEALKRTNLFDFKGTSPDFKTLALAVTPNKIIFVKSNNHTEWSDDAMKSDISEIISMVKTHQKPKAKSMHHEISGF